MADTPAEKRLSTTTPEQPKANAPEQFSVIQKEQTEKRLGEANLEAAGAETRITPSPGGKNVKLRRAGPVIVPQARDEITVKIEKILEDGIGDAYQRLSPVAKQEFKLRGEETARGIRELLKTTRVKVKKILRLILDWLKLLPGVNRFFLEQEAKIKTDRILSLQKK